MAYDDKFVLVLDKIEGLERTNKRLKARVEELNEDLKFFRRYGTEVQECQNVATSF